jgi:hypothetical protein
LEKGLIGSLQGAFPPITSVHRFWLHHDTGGKTEINPLAIAAVLDTFWFIS